MITNHDKLERSVWGFVVGDALGVPVEFSTREERKEDPVTDIRGYGTYHQPPGTWSDDSSLLLCTLEHILEGGTHTDLAYKFLRWLEDGYMTPHGDVFDVGNATRAALMRLAEGEPWHAAGIREERSACGNGSLMRILPLAFSTQYASLDNSSQRYELVAAIAGITHAHELPHLCCFLYVELIRELVAGTDPATALDAARMQVQALLLERPDQQAARQLRTTLKRILEADFTKLAETDIQSGGYVVHSLEAALWCWRNGCSYSNIVLRAVNLGGDTDTIAALAGALGAMEYEVPEQWKSQLANRELITALLNRLKA